MPYEQTGTIVMIAGPVGAGKSAVARELVALSPGPTAYIEGDTFWSFFQKAGPGQVRRKEFYTVMRAMTAAASHYALAGYETILDFSIPPSFLKTALAVAKYHRLRLDYVVLRPSESVCAARAASRLEGRISDYSDYHDLYSSFDGAEPHTICDDIGSVQAIASEVRAGLDTGRFIVE